MAGATRESQGEDRSSGGSCCLRTRGCGDRDLVRFRKSGWVRCIDCRRCAVPNNRSEATTLGAPYRIVPPVQHWLALLRRAVHPDRRHSRSAPELRRLPRQNNGASGYASPAKWRSCLAIRSRSAWTGHPAVGCEEPADIAPLPRGFDRTCLVMPPDPGDRLIGMDTA